jgi:hypothetical protein
MEDEEITSKSDRVFHERTAEANGALLTQTIKLLTKHRFYCSKNAISFAEIEADKPK